MKSQTVVTRGIKLYGLLQNHLDKKFIQTLILWTPSFVLTVACDDIIYIQFTDFNFTVLLQIQIPCKLFVPYGNSQYYHVDLLSPIIMYNDLCWAVPTC